MAKAKKTAAKRGRTHAAVPARSAFDVASYFQTKLEAEWGPFDLKHALDARPERIVVLDTRMTDAFNQERIQGAINIPEAQLESRLSELPKDKEIVTYCWNITCRLATRVALRLAQKGFKVHELVGGIASWKASNFPVESETRQPVGAA